MENYNAVTGEQYGGLKPTVDSVFSNGWNRTWKNFFELLLALIVLFAAATPMMISGFVFGQYYYYEGSTLGFFLFIYGYLVLVPMRYGMANIYLQAARGTRCSASGFGAAFSSYLHVILSALITQVLVTVGVIFFIIPGIIVACKLAFVPYLVTDRKLDAIEAVQTSWNMTRGYTLSIFMIYFLFIPIQVAGFLAMVVGTIPATMWCGTSLASMYHAVEKRMMDDQIDGNDSLPGDNPEIESSME
ncbi:MAG: hypothetical protein KOO63_10395 [Bacteroidales bacterium]|nr:hypothetical protein [Candidatus Latescibacterota bacterium]